MSKKIILIASACLALAGCATSKPHIVQASSDMQEVRLTSGMATQIEMPDSMRVQSVVTGNPNLVTAERADNVVNLVPKEGSGETNLIVRATDSDGDTKVYQYRVIVQGH
jgi:type IV secretory pathway VirB9-like protein